MPNWCEQIAHFSHPDKEVIDKIKEAIKNESLMEYTIPSPKDWESLDLHKENISDADKLQSELEARAKRNLERFGFKSIIDWQYSVRGTKWDIIEGNIIYKQKRNNKYYLKASFQTAWGAPFETFIALQEKHPELHVKVYYHEPLMAFCGKYENKKVSHYQIEKETIADIPLEIKKAFSFDNEFFDQLFWDPEEKKEQQ